MKRWLPPLSLSAFFSPALVAYWQGCSVREKWMILLAMAVVCGYATWAILLAPALQGRRQWQAELPQLRAEYAQMQALNQKLLALPTRPPSAVLSIDQAALERRLAQRGLKTETLFLQSSGTGVAVLRVSFKEVAFSTLLEWLQQEQRESQWAVLEAHITPQERIDRIDAQLVLQRAP